MKFKFQKQLTFLILFSAALSFTVSSFAQDNQKQPFQNEIQYFKKLDSFYMPPTGKILMIGSSSFTNWKDVSHYLPGYPFINRGFGGASLTHLIYYFDDIVEPYQPRQILIYCGENDLSGNATTDMVVERFKKLFNMIREKDRNVMITYISMKPSPSRYFLLDKMKEGNSRIKEWLATKERAAYVDVYSKMVDENGKPIPEIYKKDNLHMNGKGYFIWAKEIRPFLLKD